MANIVTTSDMCDFELVFRETEERNFGKPIPEPEKPKRRARTPLLLDTLRKAELLGVSSEGRLPMTRNQRLSLNLALVSLGIDLSKLGDGAPHTTILDDESAVMLPPECGVQGTL